MRFSTEGPSPDAGSRSGVLVGLLGVALMASTSIAGADSGSYRIFWDDSAEETISFVSDRALGLGDPATLFGSGVSEPAGFRLDLRFPRAASAAAPGFLEPSSLVSARKPSLALGVLVALGAFGGSARNSWKGGRFSNFHFTNEGFFGRDTYTGGVDKASHFVDYNVAARAITMAYEELGYSEPRSQFLGATVGFLAGLVTEIGDATTSYGFSYEDLVMDAFGSATALGLAATGWDDTIGFRLGRFDPDRTPACCYTVANYGRDYSGEIYTGDLKLVGVARRLRLRPGPARYLLLSMNYSTNGYRYAVRAIRQRLLGIEIGVNFAAIAERLGLPQKTWWGRPIYFFLESFRLPYTGIGFRFDLNHRKWYGPTTGRTRFDPSEASGGR